jgi:hypothetical protein
MLKFLLGDRIAKACTASWHLDGWDGRMSALVVVLSVAISVGGGFVKLVQAVI